MNQIYCNACTTHQSWGECRRDSSVSGLHQYWHWHQDGGSRAVAWSPPLLFDYHDNYSANRSCYSCSEIKIHCRCVHGIFFHNRLCKQHSARHQLQQCTSLPNWLSQKYLSKVNRENWITEHIPPGTQLKSCNTHSATMHDWERSFSKPVCRSEEFTQIIRMGSICKATSFFTLLPLCSQAKSWQVSVLFAKISALH